MYTETPQGEACSLQEYIELKELNGVDDPSVLTTRNRIFFWYRPLAQKRAKRYARNCMPYRSLIDPCDIKSDADIGLLKAIDTFQLGMGTKFESHAFTRINGSIIDGIRGLQEFPRIVAKIRRELTPVLMALSNELGHKATLEDVVIYFPHLEHMCRDPLVSASVFNQPVSRKSSGDDEGGSEEYEDSIEHQLIKTRSKRTLDRMELSDTIEAVLSALHEDAFERRVIYCYFFLGMTSTKISKTMQISPTWVSGKKSSGLQKLRKLARTNQEFADELRKLSFS